LLKVALNTIKQTKQPSNKNPFTPWYGWKIALLVLHNNRSLMLS
jgi:hypothetical protein